MRKNIQEISVPHLFPNPSPTSLSRWDLVAMLPLRLQSRVFINGFPGAGNVIVQRLCEDILKTTDQKDLKIKLNVSSTGEIYDDALSLLNSMGDRYGQFLELFRNALPTGWEEDGFFENRRMGQMNFVARKYPNFMMMTGIDLGVHLNAQIHSSHEIPSVESYAAYNALGFHILPVVRHPLDIIVSYVSKVASHSFLQTLDVPTSKEQKNKARQEYCLAVGRQCIRDDRWLQIATSCIRSFYLPIVQMADQYQPIHFSDILSNPQQSVSRLASRMGIDINEENAERISSIIGTLELAPGHFNSPSCDKWKDFFSRESYDMLLASGIFDLFAPLGYTVPKRRDFPNHKQSRRKRWGIGDMSATIKMPLPTGTPINNEAFYMDLYSGLCSTFDPIELARQFGMSDIQHIWHGRFAIVSNDSVLLKTFSDNLTSGLLAKLEDTKSAFCQEHEGKMVASDSSNQEAEDVYREVLRMLPNHLPALEGLSGVLMARGQHQEALGLLNAAIVQAPNKPEIITARARAKMALQDTTP